MSGQTEVGAGGGQSLDELMRLEVIPWLHVVRSEFLPDDDNLGRESDIAMRRALDWATEFVSSHCKCLAPEYPPKTEGAYALLAAEGWEWNDDDWTRPPFPASTLSDESALPSANSAFDGGVGAGLTLDDLAQRMANGYPMAAIVHALDKAAPGIRGAFAPPAAIAKATGASA